MRPKSVKKFKGKIRELTCRKHNLDSAPVDELNRVIRVPLILCYMVLYGSQELRLDCWIRMRLRCMKTKVKSRCDHLKLHNKVFDRLGLLDWKAFVFIRHDRKSRFCSPRGQSLWGPGA